MKQVAGGSAEPGLRPRQQGKRPVELSREAVALSLFVEAGAHVLGSREARRRLARRLAAEHAQPELDAAADAAQAVLERRRLRLYSGRELLLARECTAEARGKKRSASRHQLLDHARVRQQGLVRHPWKLKPCLADHEIEAGDLPALERRALDPSEGRQLLESPNERIEVDHDCAPAAASVRSRCSSSVATDESKTRRPT